MQEPLVTLARSRRGRLAAGFALAIALAVPSTGYASSIPGEPQPELRLHPETLELHWNGSAGYTDPSHLWTWSAGRRGYNLFMPQETGDNQTNFTYKFLGMTDLDTGTPLEVVAFPPGAPAWSAHDGAASLMRGKPPTMLVDEQSGLLFVAYAGSEPGKIINSAGPALGDVAEQRNCTRGAATVTASCLGGYHIYDGRTLAYVGRLPIRFIRADGGAPFLIPRAVAYAGGGAGNSGALYALVEDSSAENAGGSATFGGTYAAFNQARHFLVKFDVGAQRQDWMVPVPECAAARELGMNADERKPEGVGRKGNPAALVIIDGAVWIGCHADTRRTGVAVRVQLDEHGDLAAGGTQGPDAVTPPTQDPDGALSGPSDRGSTQGDDLAERGNLALVGPEGVVEILADPTGRRMVFRVIQTEPVAETWVVFDVERGEYVGRIGTGGRPKEPRLKFGYYATGASAIDVSKGRLYVYHHDEGLYVADIRRNPLPQAQFFPEFRGLQEAQFQEKMHLPLAVDARPDGTVGVLVRSTREAYRRIEDARPAAVDPLADEFGGRTLDIDEAEGVTRAVLDGAVRGYGARELLIGGAEAATRLRYADSVGTGRAAVASVPGELDTVTSSTTKSVDNFVQALARALKLAVPSTSARTGELNEVPWRDACSDQDRDIVFGYVGPKEAAVVDDSGSRGSAAPVVVDGTTAADLEAPVGRCIRKDWEQLWGTALFGRPPLDQPGIPSGALGVTATCLASDGDETAQSSADATTSAFFAEARCGDAEVSGFAYARGGTDQFRVGEALSSFRIYRDPQRGMVSRVESVARGVRIDGVVTIDTVRGVAESWANGRRQPVAEGDREPGYDPNCDVERTAGSCFQRQIFGVRSPVWSCGPCGDEAALIAGMQSIFGVESRIRLRQPDPTLARGSENGYIAAIVKSKDEHFADLVFNADTITGIVPTLEIVRYANPMGLPGVSYKSDRSGRQIYQFAGVQVSSSYSIQCLLIYDEATNTCAAAQEPPGSLALELTSADGRPLAGGAFELRADTDGDGVVGLVDTLVPEGACVTAEDGVGTCTWEGLAPGTYVVTQIAAPPGYSAVKEPYAVELVSGEARTVTFTNVSNVSTVAVSAADEQDKPLQGAAFAVYADPDADGKVAPDAKPVAQCETGPDGTCTMSVPTGSYVLVQLGAPAGLEPIEPVAFALTAGGETAAVTVVNYPPDIAAPPPAAAPVAYVPPVLPPLPTLHAVPLPVAGIPMDDEPDVAGPGIGGTVVRVIQAPGDVLRLLARDPVQAAAFAATLLLLTLAWAGVQRRRQLLMLTTDLSG